MACRCFWIHHIRNNLYWFKSSRDFYRSLEYNCCSGILFSLSPIFNLLFKQRYDYVVGMMPIRPKNMSSSRQEIKTESFLKNFRIQIECNAIIPFHSYDYLINTFEIVLLFLYHMSGLTGIYCWL